MAETMAMKLHLEFACNLHGECGREFFCINPHYVLNTVCPHLIAWDGLTKFLRNQDIPLVKKKKL